jgi:hypothetical protein
MTKKTVRAVRDVGVYRGATGPHLMECDDGLTYVVKFAGRSRAVVNEYLGQRLARALSLPCPESALVEVTAELISHSSDMRSRSVAPGVHQGSELVSNSSDLVALAGRHGRLDEDLVNWEVLPGTICLDNLILTEDRDRAENHLVQAVPGGFRYYMVDFSHSFTGESWTADSLVQGSSVRNLMPMLPQIAEAVRAESSLEAQLRRVEKIPDSLIEDVVTAVPAAWGVSEEERLVLVRFLETRRGLLRSVLTTNRGMFPNWSG